MKAREIFKKVENYNEVAKVLGDKGARVLFRDEVSINSFTEWDDFKKFIRNEYIKPVPDILLSFNGFESDKEVCLSYRSDWDDEDRNFTCSLAIDRIY